MSSQCYWIFTIQKMQDFPHRKCIKLIRFSCHAYNRISSSRSQLKLTGTLSCRYDSFVFTKSQPLLHKMTQNSVKWQWLHPSLMADSLLQVDHQHLHHNVHKCPPPPKKKKNSYFPFQPKKKLNVECVTVQRSSWHVLVPFTKTSVVIAKKRKCNYNNNT